MKDGPHIQTVAEMKEIWLRLPLIPVKKVGEEISHMWTGYISGIPCRLTRQQTERDEIIALDLVVEDRSATAKLFTTLFAIFGQVTMSKRTFDVPTDTLIIQVAWPQKRIYVFN